MVTPELLSAQARLTQAHRTLEYYQKERDHWDRDNLIDDLRADLENEVTTKLLDMALIELTLMVEDIGVQEVTVDEGEESVTYSMVLDLGEVETWIWRFG